VTAPRPQRACEGYKSQPRNPHGCASPRRAHAKPAPRPRQARAALSSDRAALAAGL